MAIVTSNEYDHIDVVNGSNTNRHYIKDTTARNNIKDLKGAFERDGSIISANLMGIDVQQNLYPGAADWSGTWFISDSANLKLSDTKYNGYPVYHSTQGWRIIRKEIFVEAGKTYTFSARIRPSETAACFIYIIPNEVTEPATINSNMSQFNNTEANVWHRFTKTFTCSASGYISPYCMANKAYDVAMYELVEGDTVFSLSGAFEHMLSRHVYHVEKNGSGDFTSLVEAVNTACRFMDSIVYVGAGTWDIVSELGETYLNGVSSSQRGLYLKNRVHIICSSEALITCKYTGTREDTITWLSAFNAGEYGFTLENARIESSKCKYAIHDERGIAEDAYTNKYLNCNIKHDNTNGGYTQCIGGGLGKNGHIVISGCVFENPNASNGDVVSYHNTWYSGGTGKSNVEVTGCYFKGTTTFRASWFGASQEISEFIVHDNSVGYPIIHRAENQSMMDDNPTWIQNTELLEWNNVVRN